ncbi:monocarboxylate transporter 9-like [Tubulanus polymorphus]|uniref:monocarboxylate transporter 9-like n=1 Tax=Tubulanus polymorphus TaxID=672921 RepID=UPI003DA566AF
MAEGHASTMSQTLDSDRIGTKQLMALRTRTRTVSERSDLPVIEETAILETEPTEEHIDTSDEYFQKMDEEYPEPYGFECVVLIVSGFISCLLCGGPAISSGILVAEWMDVFQMGSSTTSWLGTGISGVLCMTGPLASFLVKKFNYRPVMFAGGLLTGVPIIISAFSPNIYIIMFTWMLAGLGSGLLCTPLIAYITYRFRRLRSLANGVVLAGYSAGGFVFTFIINALLLEYGWRGCVLILGGLSLNICSITLFLRNWHVKPAPKTSKASKPLISNGNALNGDRHRHTRVTFNESNATNGRDIHMNKEDILNEIAGMKNITNGELSNNSNTLADNELNSQETTGTIEQPCCGQDSDYDELKSLLQLSVFKNSMFPVFMIHNFLLYFSVSIIYVLLVAATRDIVGVEPFYARYTLSALAITNLFARFAVSLMVNHPKVDTFTVHILFCLTCGLLTISYPFCVSYAMALAFSGLLGLAMAGYPILTQLVIAEHIGEIYILSAYGYSLCAGGIGFIIGAPVAGALYDATSDFTYSFFLAGGAMVGSAAIMLPEWIRHFRALTVKADPEHPDLRNVHVLSRQSQLWVSSHLSLV